MASGRGGAADLNARIRAEALRRAIDEVATIDAMAAGARLQSYRSYLQATVRFASPILLAAVNREGLPLGDALHALRPPPGWPDRLHAGHAHRHFAAATVAGGARVIKSPPPMGVVFLGDGAARVLTRSFGVITVRVVGCSIEVSMRLGVARLSSGRGLGRIRLDRFVPETVALGCIGRPLVTVVDHPLLRRQDWTVDHIEGRAEGRKSSVVVFATGCEPVTLPWGRA